MQRRRFLRIVSSSVLPAITAVAAPEQPLVMEAYIWQQYAARQGKKLGDVLDEVFAMAVESGFRNVELNQEFFAPPLRDRVLDLVRTKELRLPSVYVGGVMHRREDAAETIRRGLEIAQLLKPFGCVGVVHNPSPKAKGEQKSDEELAIQTGSLNRFGEALAAEGFELRVHHHTPEMANGAREWRQILRTTNARAVSLCIDVDWVHQGGEDPLSLLREAGTRVRELHLRNSSNKIWLESLADGDVDYRQVAAYLKQAKLRPELVVELAYMEKTVLTRSLTEDLRLSREYAARIFSAGA